MTQMAATSRGGEWISILEKLSLDRAEKLLNELGESYCDLQNQGPVPEHYEELSLEDFERSTQALSDLFKTLCLSPSAATSNGNGSLSAGVSWEHLSSPYKEKVRQVVLRHEEGIRLRFLREETLPRRFLTHFDWEAEMVVASSQLNAQETPLLRISLALQGAGSSSSSTQVETAILEMQRPQLDRTISLLESCLEGRSTGNTSEATKNSTIETFGELQTTND